MKAILLSLALSLFGFSAAAKVCSGTIEVDNLGYVSKEKASLEFTSENSAVYSGPHASIFLGDKVELKFVPGAEGYYVADLSSSGHGGETNTFWYRFESETKLTFVYVGSYGYTARGTLTCK